MILANPVASCLSVPFWWLECNVYVVCLLGEINWFCSFFDSGLFLCPGAVLHGSTLL